MTTNSTTAEDRLAELGVHLPDAPTPFGAYVPAVQTGNLLFLSGMLATSGHMAAVVGVVGKDLDVKAAREAAYTAALNVLALTKKQLGSLNRVSRVVRLGVYVAATPEFTEHPKVADAASTLLRDVFGEQTVSSRLVFGVASLPLGSPVELEVILEVDLIELANNNATGMATLIAVNVGLPRDVPWRGATVHTGAWKQTVTGPRMVRRLNVDGDGQGDLGGHGGEQRAVLVYQTDSYRYWQQQLGRADLVYGQFGENLTVDGLPDDEVCIGDQYRIGGAVFEVTQPRVTCYRVGMRLNEPRMAALLVSHHRPGFYMRVLVEGEVRAGDEIVKVASGPEAMSVAEIDALLYLPGHAREQLVRALRIPALSPGWKPALQALLDQADGSDGKASGNPGLTTAAGAPAPAWTGFRPLRVVRIADESRSIFSLHLALPDGAPLPAALPGQFLTLRLPAQGGGGPLIRSYSLSGRPGAAEYRISVKQETHGAGSAYLRTHVQAGDTLESAAPRGTFTLRAGAGPVLLLSAGVGATPVLAMLHALAGERSTREVWWLHGARNGVEHAFAAEARALLAQLPNARAHVCYSRPEPADVPGSDYATTGRLSAELLGTLALPRNAEAYLCGPAEFLRDVSAALLSSGFAASQVQSEIFGAAPAMTPGVVGATTQAPHAPASEPGSGPAVSFARSGLNVHWDASYASLLELAEACSVPTRWSCRTGVCHTCETGMLSGAVDHSPEPIEAPAEGNVLICCARPRGDVVLDL